MSLARSAKRHLREMAASRSARSVLRTVGSGLSVLTSQRTGTLAIDGGRPVRSPELWPWASVADHNVLDWSARIRASLRSIYVGGVEGLPQPLGGQFAEEWARYCGAKYGVLVGHGTDALRIALAAALEHDGLSYGGEIIVPNFSFIASATAALDRRFGVALVDVDPATLLLAPDRVEEAIVAGRTKAIMAVHLFGQPADLTRLRSIAQKHSLKIIEDAAQAHGAAWEGQRVGSVGDVAGFSFQSSKTISCGEGGALVTNDANVFERAYSMHNVGRARQGGARWEHFTLGWNCRATEYQAALLLHRLRKFPAQQERRAVNFALLRDLLGDCRSVTPLRVPNGVTSHGMYMFAMRYTPSLCGDVDIDRFIRCLRSEGIPVARAFASTISEQPAIARLTESHPDYVRVLKTPVADQATRDTFYVPHEVFLGGRKDMEDIAAAVRKVERWYATSAPAGQRRSGS